MVVGKKTEMVKNLPAGQGFKEEKKKYTTALPPPK